MSATLADHLRSTGRVPFRTFMELALYDPELGYYAQPDRTTGKQGDFATAADASVLLGATLATAIERFEGQLRVAEIGPGSGRLMQDLVAAVPHDVRDRVTFQAVEPFEARRGPLGERLDDAVEVVSSLPRSVLPSFVFANEVLDAQPVDLVERTRDGWRQLFVGHEGDTFVGTWAEAEPDVAAFADRFGRSLPVGNRYEVNRAIGALLEAWSSSFERGVLLFLDYGGAHGDIWPDRPEGTVRGFRGHRVVDPLSAPGETDITADVDLDVVAAEAARIGLSVAARGPQEHLLVHLGLVELARERGLLTEAKQLLVPGAFAGRFQAIVLDKGGLADELGLTADLTGPQLWDRH